MKICIVTCYTQPDYVRALTLRAAAAELGHEVVVVKNARRGVIRFLEVPYKLLRERRRSKPDMYLLTFRGYEVLPLIRLITLKKPLIYDEFINPIEWLAYEHKKLRPRNPLTMLLAVYYRLLLKSVQSILADTQSHAELSSELMRVPIERYVSVPVGTDETTFGVTDPEESEAKELTVLYYGNMLPLHGLKYVIEAAVKLNHEPIRFVIVGGSDKTAHDVAFAVGNGAKIDYRAWVEFDQLPALMRSSDLCLAGPFGATFQADYVITGKAFQYMAMGRPIVVGQNRESHVFTDKQDALIVKQGDADALADTLRWAMTHRSQLYDIGKAGQELFKANFSTKQVAERLSVAIDAATPKAGANSKAKQ